MKCFWEMTDLRVESLARFDWVVWVAKNESLLDLVLLHALDFHFDVLATGHFGHLDVVRPELVHFHLSPVGVNCQGLT